MASLRNRGADALARALSVGGVRRLFTLSGNHVMPVFDACIDARIELLHVRHEAATVHMADAWARLTGEVGVALVTGGPGHANAIGALYTAAMAEAPVVLLSGHAATDQLGMGAFQEMRQADIAAPLCKASITSQSADRLAADVAQAMRIAASGRPGPVHVSLPNDALDHAADLSLVPAHDAFIPGVASLDAAVASALVSRLRAAQRPLVLCGPACATREGRAGMRVLEEASGIPVVAMESPRGIADPSLGAFAQVLAQADVVLLVGKRPDFTLRFARPPAVSATCEILQVQPDAGDVRADAFAALDALAKAAMDAGAVRSGWCRDVSDAIAWRPAEWQNAASDPGRLHPVQALRPLQALLDAHPEAVFVSDGGEFGQWAQACLRAPRRVINGVAGSIGAGLPFASAAKLAAGAAPVIAAMGDGTFGFHPAEIDTAVRYGLPFLAIVGNDARWNAEYQIQLRDYGAGRLVGCELLPARYDQVAIGFGGYGEHVTEAAQLLPAAQRALASGKPAVLNVMVEGLAAPTMRRA